MIEGVVLNREQVIYLRAGEDSSEFSCSRVGGRSIHVSTISERMVTLTNANISGHCREKQDPWRVLTQRLEGILEEGICS
jgi:hypothetical protein